MVRAQLGDVDTYKILSQSECTTLDGVDDAEEFSTVKAAFDTIGMESESQTQVRGVAPPSTRAVSTLALGKAPGGVDVRCPFLLGPRESRLFPLLCSDGPVPLPGTMKCASFQ